MTLTKTSDALGGLNVTDVFWWNYNAKERIVVNQGGSSSGKTYNILMVLFLRCISKPRSYCTVVGSTIPNLKKGALRDMERIMSDNPSLNAYIRAYNKTARIYEFTNGAQMEFVSYEDGLQARSGKRDYAFFNEANSIKHEVYNQVAMRTTEQIYIDYNPTAAFWVHSHVIGQPNTVVFYSTFKNNHFAHPAAVAHIRKFKTTDPEAWRVYGLGKTGALQGLVFPRVNLLADFPKIYRKFAYGLDFGFNDPTACTFVGEADGALFVREVLYAYELTGKEIADKIRPIVKDFPVWCDSASPMTIKELKAAGINARPAIKGADSIMAGINLLKQFSSINLHKEDTNLLKEQQNYRWAVKNDVQLDRPTDSFNHLWDATRYAATMTWGKMGQTPQML